jgi:hypothetical protein
LRLATAAGSAFGAAIAGQVSAGSAHERDTIRSGNPIPLYAPFDDGRLRHWFLGIHLVDGDRRYGRFLQELLTIRGPR